MKETRGSILLKLGAIFSFLFLIVGGFSITIYYIETSDWNNLWYGVIVLLLGFFVTAALVPYIARHDGDLDFEHLTFGKSIKGAAMFTFFASFLVFTGFSMYFWIELGLYQIGLAGIASLIIMIVIAVIVSIRYQTGAARKALKDPSGIELIGTVVAIEAHFSMQVMRKFIVFFYRIRLNVGGRHSTTYLRAKDKLLEELEIGDFVNVKISLKDPSYCAILEKNVTSEN